ncbi:MAG TPA: hypothetical protein VGY13_14020 [Solirubrobacteraceae bacterium]|jgi:hypothetical protein|nr:hypothetical protein [Solirubrobacteraceae bacterium]
MSSTRATPGSRTRALGASLLAALIGLGALAGTSVASLSAREASLLRHDDRGLYVHYCPRGQEAASIATAASSADAAQPTSLLAAGASPFAPLARTAEANHDGWPADECLKMDKGGAGLSHTLVGLQNVHNWLLGGYGNDTFYAGARGDVIWGDYHPEGQPESQSDYIHGGAGEDWIYASHGFNEIWTGAGNDHLALVYGHGIVYCDGKGVKTFVMRYLPQNRPWKLVGCNHKVIDPYRA